MKVSVLVLIGAAVTASLQQGDATCTEPGETCSNSCSDIAAILDELDTFGISSFSAPVLREYVESKRCGDLSENKFCCVPKAKIETATEEVSCGRPLVGTTGRIRNDPQTNKWPWMASFGLREPDFTNSVDQRTGGFSAVGRWVHKCGGTLVSKKFVLTAAHCFDQGDIPSIRLGDANLDSAVDDGTFVHETSVASVVRHPRYKFPEAYFDVALAEMASEPSFSDRVLPVCLPPRSTADHKDLIDTSVTVTGWGLAFRLQLKSQREQVLQRVRLQVFSPEFCNVTHEDVQFVRGRSAPGVQARRSVPRLFTPEILCAGEASGGAGSCKGDSGGPLVRFVSDQAADPFYMQVGVIHGGIGRCGDAEFPDIFARLTDRNVLGFVRRVLGLPPEPEPLDFGGAWSEWGEWSGCDDSDGCSETSVRRRTRFCPGASIRLDIARDAHLQGNPLPFPEFNSHCPFLGSGVQIEPCARAPECSGVEDCSFYGVFLNGFGDRLPAFELSLPDERACSETCAESDGCRYWSFVTGWAVNCYLFTRVFGEHLQIVGALSGSIGVSPCDPGSAIAGFALDNDRTLECRAPADTFFGELATPTDALGGLVFNTEAECRTECARRKTCHFWSFVPHWRVPCYIGARQNDERVILGAVSGTVGIACEGDDKKASILINK